MRKIRPIRELERLQALYFDSVERFNGFLDMFYDKEMRKRNWRQLVFICEELYKQLLVLEKEIDTFLKYFSKLDIDRKLIGFQSNIVEMRHVLKRLVSNDCQADKTLAKKDGS